MKTQEKAGHSGKADKGIPPVDKVLRPGPDDEIGGAPGPEPTRYGDWENKGHVSDF